MRRLGLGRFEMADWLSAPELRWPDDLVGGHHHMGTTRMSTDARTGVVNADQRAHAVDNLYVTGSSVFPTAGYANPTMTVLALALRLGEHLRATA
jgi:choline dehydrogenase-like flavoprotein